MEEKPFKRITKRLTDPKNSFILIPPTLPPTPPPDGPAADEAAAAFEKDRQLQLEKRRQWHEDVLLDFAAFESSIIRIQFLFTTNVKERERYATEKVKIQATAQAVRDNTADLRIQLEEAQKTLALRKEYDTMAEIITGNPLLMPRAEQHANLAKMNAEIADLERERQEYAHTWAERRQQFGKIMDEGMQLRRLIRDEKEEVDRSEGMEEREDGESEGRGRSGHSTPHREMRGLTPMPHRSSQEQEGGTPNGLMVERDRSVRGKSPLSHSQLVDDVKTKRLGVEDEEMAEDGELEAESEGVTAAPVEGLVAVDDKDEGEMDDFQINEGKAADQMDTS